MWVVQRLQLADYKKEKEINNVETECAHFSLPFSFTEMASAMVRFTARQTSSPICAQLLHWWDQEEAQRYHSSRWLPTGKISLFCWWYLHLSWRNYHFRSTPLWCRFGRFHRTVSVIGGVTNQLRIYYADKHWNVCWIIKPSDVNLHSFSSTFEFYFKQSKCRS